MSFADCRLRYVIEEVKEVFRKANVTNRQTDHATTVVINHIVYIE